MSGLAICGLILIRGGPGTVAARDGTTPNPQARPRRIGGRIGVWEQHPILSCQAPAHDHVELNPVTPGEFAPIFFRPSGQTWGRVPPG